MASAINISDSLFNEYRSQQSNANENFNYGNVNDVNLNYGNEDYDEYSDASPALMSITKCLALYVQPVLCTFGIAGHSLSFVIFLSKSMRKISSNIYLAALSGSSVGFNLVLLLQWLEMVNVHLIHKNGFCQGLVYFSYVFRYVFFVQTFKYCHQPNVTLVAQDGYRPSRRTE